MATNRALGAGFNKTHNNLDGLDSGDYQHLTATQKTDLTDGGDSTLHYHASIGSAPFSGARYTIGGIGTTDATYSLVCKDSADLTTFAIFDSGAAYCKSSFSLGGSLYVNNSSDQIRLQSYTSTGKHWILGTAVGAATGRDFSIYESDLGNALTISQVAGDVGVGSNPVATVKLFVKSATNGDSTFPILCRNSDDVNVFYANSTGKGYFLGILGAVGSYSHVISSGVRDMQMDNSGNFGYVSSIRASKNNISYSPDISWLYTLQPASFEYRLKDEDGTYLEETDGIQQVGLIAEDVNPIRPEMVYKDIVDGEEELRGVDYKYLITPLLQAVKEQQSKIEELEQRLLAGGL